MNFLERKAVERAQKQLAPIMDDGERVLEFDMADGVLSSRDQAAVSNSPKARVHLIATTHALYAVFEGGRTQRVAYSEMTRLHCHPQDSLMAVGHPDGDVWEYIVVGKPRGLVTVVRDQVRAMKARREGD